MKRHTFRWQALTSTISTTFVLVMLGLTVLCGLTARTLSDSVRQSLTITLMLSPEATDSAAQELHKSLLKQRWTKEATYISAEEVLKEQSEAMGTDPTEFLGLNPFTAMVEMNLKADYACTDSLLWISKKLKEHQLIADVVYQRDIVERLNKNLNRAAMAMLVVVVLLMLITLVLINNTVRLGVYSRRFVIHTMKLVGASWSFIMRPFLVRALWIGLASSALALAALGAGLRAMLRYDPASAAYVPAENLAATALAVVGVGLMLTVVCTYLSVAHYLSMRESELYG